MKEGITDDEIVFALAMKYDNDLMKVADAMKNNIVMEADELFGYINSATEKYVTHNSHNYPRALKVEDKPPVAVFYDGRLDICNNADFLMDCLVLKKEDSYLRLKMKMVNVIG